MAVHRNDLPLLHGGSFLDFAGMETDLIFNQGVNLPEFASYPLLETEDGRGKMEVYHRNMIEIGRRHRMGVILESPTWLANRDRAAAIGYSAERLRDLNTRAIAFLANIRETNGDVPTIITATIGPRDDAYAPGDQMTAEQAEAYHSEQISVLADSDADLFTGYTLAYPAEAVGIVRAAKHFSLPVVISFTVETDGRLPTGTILADAIAEVDAATDSYALYYMINCAHPDHFTDALSNEPWGQRIKGVVANASRCSHAELDESEVLDDGDPVELGEQLAAIQQRFPQINILGGCCGTDMRHVLEIAKAVG